MGRTFFIIVDSDLDAIVVDDLDAVRGGLNGFTDRVELNTDDEPAELGEGMVGYLGITKAGIYEVFVDVTTAEPTPVIKAALAANRALDRFDKVQAEADEPSELEVI